MIDNPWLLLRLTAGLGTIPIAGYALLILMLPAHSRFTPLERWALSFGLGSLGLTLWMVVLSLVKVPYSLGTIAVPWLAAALPAGWLAWKRGWLSEDCRSLWTKGRILITIGYNGNLSKAERIFLLLLVAAMAFAFLRAVCYPIWAWDAVATWGLKAKAFYLARGLEMSRFEAHNYYPNLVPLLMTYLYFWLGSVVDGLVKAVFPLWGAALLMIYFSFLRRLGASRAGALGATVFLVLNGATLLTHFFIAYADLALTYYQLAAAGLIYLWLREEAPTGSGPLMAWMFGGMAWSKYEGWPLVLITLLAACLTLAWLRPPQFLKKVFSILLMGVAGWLFSLPWRLVVATQGLESGGDHIGGFYLQQLFQGIWSVLKALAWVPYFGVLWPAIFLSFIPAGRSIWQTPLMFLGLFVAGNLAATALAYAIVPASPAEFPMYVRATVDRLLLHVAPASALILSVPLASPERALSECRDFH